MLFLALSCPFLPFPSLSYPFLPFPALSCTHLSTLALPILFNQGKGTLTLALKEMGALSYGCMSPWGYGEMNRQTEPDSISLDIQIEMATLLKLLTLSAFYNLYTNTRKNTQQEMKRYLITLLRDCW